MTDSGVTEALLELRRLISPLTKQGEDRIWRPAEKACALIDKTEEDLAMRKLDPALAIPNDEGIREARDFIDFNGFECEYDDSPEENECFTIQWPNGQILVAFAQGKVLCRPNEKSSFAVMDLAATPSPVEDDEMIERVVERICRDVCELPDRSSPEDEPDMVLVTLGELAEIARAAIAATKGDA